MIKDRRHAARRKLLGILSRSSLESLSGLDRPWLAAKSDLLERAAGRWSEGAVKEEIEKLFRRASR